MENGNWDFWHVKFQECTPSYVMIYVIISHHIQYVIICHHTHHTPSTITHHHRFIDHQVSSNMIIHLHNSWKIIAKGAWTSFIYTIILIHVKSNTPRYHLHRSFGNRRSFGGPMCNILGMSIPGTNSNSRDISLFSAEKWMCWKMCSDVLFCAEHLVLRYSKIHHQEMNRWWIDQHWVQWKKTSEAQVTAISHGSIRICTVRSGRV